MRQRRSEFRRELAESVDEGFLKEFPAGQKRTNPQVMKGGLGIGRSMVSLAVSSMDLEPGLSKQVTELGQERLAINNIIVRMKARLLPGAPKLALDLDQVSRLCKRGSTSLEDGVLDEQGQREALHFRGLRVSRENFEDSMGRYAALADTGRFKQVYEEMDFFAYLGVYDNVNTAKMERLLGGDEKETMDRITESTSLVGRRLFNMFQ